MHSIVLEENLRANSIWLCIVTRHIFTEEAPVTWQIPSIMEAKLTNLNFRPTGAISRPHSSFYRVFQRQTGWWTCCFRPRQSGRCRFHPQELQASITGLSNSQIVVMMNSEYMDLASLLPFSSSYVIMLVLNRTRTYIFLSHLLANAPKSLASIDGSILLPYTP